MFNTSKEHWLEIVGWCGTIAIIAAFALVSFGVLPAASLPYQLLNMIGAAAFITVALAKNIKSLLMLNAVWFTIALVAIIKLLVS